MVLVVARKGKRFKREQRRGLKIHFLLVVYMNVVPYLIRVRGVKSTKESFKKWLFRVLKNLLASCKRLHVKKCNFLTVRLLGLSVFERGTTPSKTSLFPLLELLHPVLLPVHSSPPRFQQTQLKPPQKTPTVRSGSEPNPYLVGHAESWTILLHSASSWVLWILDW